VQLLPTCKKSVCIRQPPVTNIATHKENAIKNDVTCRQITAKLKSNMDFFYRFWKKTTEILFLFSWVKYIHFENRRTIYSYFHFGRKNSSFRLPYQRPSSSPDCVKELFKGSNGSASLVDCTRKKFFGWGCGFFVTDVISVVLGSFCLT